MSEKEKELNELKKDFDLFIQTIEGFCTNEENTINKIKVIVKSINDFFKREKLDSCTLGISGGIDSAVVLALLVEAQKQEDSPLKKIVPVSLPFEYALGATKQREAKDYANLVTKTLTGNDIKVIDLSRVYITLLGFAKVPENEEFSWANGQMLSVMRTPALYHQAALLQKDGYKSIVVGTINRTEFNLGYWGKASDMMVDLQPIINLFKFEVYAIAKKLGVPQEIIDRTPQGDVSTGETDLEMIGAPYEFLDMFTYDVDFSVPGKDFLDEKKYKHLFNIINETQLKRNRHKFKVGYPCHFLEF